MCVFKCYYVLCVYQCFIMYMQHVRGLQALCCTINLNLNLILVAAWLSSNKMK